MDVTNVAAICKALGDPNRLQIVQLLSDGEKCGCKLLLWCELRSGNNETGGNQKKEPGVIFSNTF